MSGNEDKRQELLRTLSRGLAYAAPLMIAVAGYASAYAIVADAVSADGYQMTAVSEAEGQAEGQAEGEAEGEGEAEAY